MDRSFLERFICNLRRLYSNQVDPEEIDTLENCIKEKLEARQR